MICLFSSIKSLGRLYRTSPRGLSRTLLDVQGARMRTRMRVVTDLTASLPQASRLSIAVSDKVIARHSEPSKLLESIVYMAFKTHRNRRSPAR